MICPGRLATVSVNEAPFNTCVASVIFAALAMANNPGSFPTELVAYFGLACAVTGAAVALTWFIGRDFVQWWSARRWSPTTCTLIRVDPEIRYRYEVNGRVYESGVVGIASQSTPLAEIVDRPVTGAHVPCWFNPAEPAQALLHREYPGWWWLPGAWLLAAFLLASTAPATFGGLWQWLTHKPDPPLTWAQWFATFYQGNGWAHSVLGLSCLIPGLLLLKFMTFDTWWNWWQAQSWVETSCRITRSEIRNWSSLQASRPGASGYLLDIAYTYEFAGQRWTGTRYSPWRMGDTEWLLQAGDSASILRLQQKYAVDSVHSCYVSPTEPGRAYMFRDRTGTSLYLSSTWSTVLIVLGLVILAARR